jgi:hypothetical protein
MASDTSPRKWTKAEDQLLLDLIYGYNISNDPQAKFPEITWRHIACCMNELSNPRGLVKIRLYDEAEVAARYYDHLREKQAGAIGVAREMIGGDKEGAGKEGQGD